MRLRSWKGVESAVGKKEEKEGIPGADKWGGTDCWGLGI